MYKLLLQQLCIFVLLNCLYASQDNLSSSKLRRRDVVAGAAAAAAAAKPRIVGGNDVATNKYPFFAYWDVGCGATVISKTLLISAAHCIENNTDIGDDFGSVYINSIKYGEGVVYDVEKVWVHPNYNGDHSYRPLWDFVLLRVNDVIPEDVAIPVVLNDDPNVPSLDDAMLTMIGFGALDEDSGEYPDILQEVNVAFLPTPQCQTLWTDSTISRAEMCSLNPNNFQTPKDSCWGDSGGPVLTKDNVQVGIISWGDGCGQAYRPAVNARISAVTNSWVRPMVCQNTGPNIPLPAYCRTLKIDLPLSLRVDFYFLEEYFSNNGYNADDDKIVQIQVDAGEKGSNGDDEEEDGSEIDVDAGEDIMDAETETLSYTEIFQNINQRYVDDEIAYDDDEEEDGVDDNVDDDGVEMIRLQVDASELFQRIKMTLGLYKVDPPTTLFEMEGGIQFSESNVSQEIAFVGNGTNTTITTPSPVATPIAAISRNENDRRELKSVLAVSREFSYLDPGLYYFRMHQEMYDILYRGTFYRIQVVQGNVTAGEHILLDVNGSNYTGSFEAYIDLKPSVSLLDYRPPIPSRMDDSNAVDDDDFNDNDAVDDDTDDDDHLADKITNVYVDIFYDNYTSETSWWILNLEKDEIVFEVDGRDDTIRPGLAAYHLPIPKSDAKDDMFEFQIWDEAGDGICCGEKGYGWVQIWVERKKIWDFDGNFTDGFSKILSF